MKSFKFLVAAVALALSTSASAQFANSSSRGGNGGGLVTDIPGYSRLSVAFSSLGTKTSASYDGKSVSASSDDEMSLKGFNIDYTRGIGLKSNLPLFLEVGWQVAFNTESEDHTRNSMLSIAIPIDLTYRVQLASGFYVAPYLGMRLKANVIGKSKYSDGSYSESINWFDKDDMGEDGTFNRFQVGGIAGANIGYKQFNFNIGYQFDSPLYKESESGYTMKIKTGGIVVGVGYNF